MMIKGFEYDVAMPQAIMLHNLKSMFANYQQPIGYDAAKNYTTLDQYLPVAIMAIYK